MDPNKRSYIKDLDVDRVDGVDRPATGRSFILFKNRDGQPVEKAEDTAESYDIATDLNTTDKERMPSRRVGDAHLVESKVTYMPETTRVYETIPGSAVARDNWLQPNLGDGPITPAPKTPYECSYPDGQKLHKDNFASPDGESGIATPADYVPSKPAVLKRAPMFGDIIKGFTSGENGN